MAGACTGDPSAPIGDDDDPGSVGGGVSIGPLGNAGSLSLGGTASGNSNGIGGSSTPSPSAPLSDGTVASGCGCSLPRRSSTGWLAALLLLAALACVGASSEPQSA